MKTMIAKYKKDGLNDDQISQELTNYFREGTLVEYEHRRGFDAELGRARVKSVWVIGAGIEVDPGERIEGPDRGASLAIMSFEAMGEEEVDKVIYMENRGNLCCYAISPPGTEIPKSRKR